MNFQQVFLTISFLQVVAYGRYSFIITELEIVNNRPDVLANLEYTMKKVNRTFSVANASFNVTQPLTTFPMFVELSRVNGATNYKLPLNISGDACDLLKKNIYIAKDFKRAGLSNCPIVGGYNMTDFYFDPANVPNLGVLGKYMVTVTMRLDGKPMASIKIQVEVKNK